MTEYSLELGYEDLEEDYGQNLTTQYENHEVQDASLEFTLNTQEFEEVLSLRVGTIRKF